MRPKLSLLLIDPEKRTRKYNLTTANVVSIGETSIDLNVIENTDNIASDLNKYKGFDCIVTLDGVNTLPLTHSSFEVRKKWVHLHEYNEDVIINSLINTFMCNINRDRGNDKLFSIFTCTFNTPKDVIMRLYDSLTMQTYANWNWWVLDDSNSAGNVSSYLEKLHDHRVIIVKNITNHGVIGFNKHVIASACDGDYLVEIDHDDELTPDCLATLKSAFEKYPDADFVYSHAYEEMDGIPVWYNGAFGLGQGYYKDVEINGKIVREVPMTPDVTFLTLRHIVGLPNHVRCWKKDFYHKIGGHNTELAVLDDMDILIRTFLNGKMCKVDKVLYIQHEGSSNDNNGRGSTTQGNRYGEIVRTGVLLRWKYDQQIHDHLLELGYEDPIWNEEKGYSELKIITDKLPAINYTYIP